MSYYLVCKKKTNGSKCSTAIAADTKEDLVEAAMQHALSVHGLPETRGLKDVYKGSIKKGAPPA